MSNTTNRAFDENSNQIPVLSVDEVENRIDEAKTEIEGRVSSTVQSYTYDKSTIDSKINNASGCSSFSYSLPTVSSTASTQTAYTFSYIPTTLNRVGYGNRDSRGYAVGYAGFSYYRSFSVAKGSSISGSLVSCIQALAKKSHTHSAGSSTCYCNTVCVCNCDDNNNSS